MSLFRLLVICAIVCLCLIFSVTTMPTTSTPLLNQTNSASVSPGHQKNTENSSKPLIITFSTSENGTVRHLRSQATTETSFTTKTSNKVSTREPSITSTTTEDIIGTTETQSLLNRLLTKSHSSKAQKNMTHLSTKTKFLTTNSEQTTEKNFSQTTVTNFSSKQINKSTVAPGILIVKASTTTNESSRLSMNISSGINFEVTTKSEKDSEFKTTENSKKLSNFKTSSKTTEENDKYTTKEVTKEVSTGNNFLANSSNFFTSKLNENETTEISFPNKGSKSSLRTVFHSKTASMLPSTPRFNTEIVPTTSTNREVASSTSERNTTFEQSTVFEKKPHTPTANKIIQEHISSASIATAIQSTTQRINTEVVQTTSTLTELPSSTSERTPMFEQSTVSEKKSRIPTSIKRKTTKEYILTTGITNTFPSSHLSNLKTRTTPEEYESSSTESIKTINADIATSPSTTTLLKHSSTQKSKSISKKFNIPLSTTQTILNQTNSYNRSVDINAQSELDDSNKAWIAAVVIGVAFVLVVFVILLKIFCQFRESAEPVVLLSEIPIRSSFIGKRTSPDGFAVPYTGHSETEANENEGNVNSGFIQENSENDSSPPPYTNNKSVFMI